MGLESRSRLILVRHVPAQCPPGAHRLFGQEMAEKFARLPQASRDMAQKTAEQLAETDVDIASSAAATAESRPLRHTASAIGFAAVNVYPSLNRSHVNLDAVTKRAMAERREVHPLHIAAAEKLLRQPPEEPVWIMHGIMIAAVGRVLGVSADDLYSPPMGSVTELAFESDQVRIVSPVIETV